MPSLSARPIYTRDQLSKYISRIYGPADPKYTLPDLEADIKVDPLAALGRLQKKQLAHIPWGNVILHYSIHKTVSLDPNALFEKIVERGLGGYCMEVNFFFSIVLRSLGYKLYTTGGRISNSVDQNGKNPEGFAGWEHMIILANINNQTYHVDVGFANFGALSPILLKEGETVPCVPGVKARLVHRPIANNTTKQQLWVLETWNATSDAWSAGYCFSELEFLPEDFSRFSYRCSQDKTSWFTFRLICTRVLLDEEKDEVPVGTVTLVNETISRRVGATAAENVLICKTEEERVKALEKWFGVKLKEDEINGIHGMVTEIK